MPISAADAINPAFSHAKEQLLRPFRFGQWWRLALVGLLAGELGSGGSCHVNYPLNTQHRGSQQAFLAGNWPAQLTNHPALLAGVVAAVIAISLVLLVLFTYIGSVMRFILFDSIIARTATFVRVGPAGSLPVSVFFGGRFCSCSRVSPRSCLSLVFRWRASGLSAGFRILEFMYSVWCWAGSLYFLYCSCSLLLRP